MIEARKVVLALGNLPPGDPSLPGKSTDSSRYFPYAWSTAPIENVEGEREIHVVNAPSPGATASLAIGEEIAEIDMMVHAGMSYEDAIREMVRKYRSN